MKFGGLYPFFSSILSGSPALSALWIWPQKNCGRLKKFLPHFAGSFWGFRMYYILSIYVVQWLYMYLFSFKFIIHDFIILCRFLAFIESFDCINDILMASSEEPWKVQPVTTSNNKVYCWQSWFLVLLSPINRYLLLGVPTSKCDC